MFDVSRTYKHSALRWVGILAATDVENERIRSINAANQAVNAQRTVFNNNLAAMPPEQRGDQKPLEMLPIQDPLSPEDYIQKILDIATFSYADQHASRIAQSALGRLAAMTPAKQVAVLTAMGLQDLAALPPASRAAMLADVVEKRFRTLPIEQREELASLAYAEYGPQ